MAPVHRRVHLADVNSSGSNETEIVFTSASQHSTLPYEVLINSGDEGIQSVRKFIGNLSLLSVVIVGFGLIPSGRVTAQIFTNLHSFTGPDGANPIATLILSGNTLFGTTRDGGSSGSGTVFAINIDGTGFTNVYSFTAFSGPSATNSDGARPMANLLLSDKTLYGTALYGGSSGHGTVFAVNTDGTGFTNMHNFSDYLAWVSGLILSSNILYGTTDGGGSSGSGAIFAINTNGTGFTNLYNFSALTGPSHNSDGAYPLASLLLSGSTLYGTAAGGGASGAGTVFALNIDGTGFTNLHNFSFGDGNIIDAGLVLLGNTLYGAAQTGGSGGSGAVFAANTNGTGFTNLHSFTATSDGANPVTTLISSGNTLFGTAWQGGSSGNGTVFAINTDGTGFTTLHRFTGGDGGKPYGGLILLSNTLYGTTDGGGTSGNGAVFSIFIQPQLTIIPSGPNVILTWPTNYAGFTLQAATNLSSAIWTTNSPAPFIVNGQCTVTNPISGTQQFFRLSQ